jgi:2-polyprenyl-6-methoxyphenol hydroxylase-like FAD-dependent oxidoreductase
VNAPRDFVIVGGGIGGAVLGELLARAGKSVLVLEKNLQPPSFQRPEVMWPESIEVLTRLHPREVWETESALAVRGVDLFDGREWGHAITPELLRSAGLQPWFVNPNDTRELLLRRARFDLRRGVEVVSVLQERGRVVGVRARDVTTRAEEDVLASCTVGDAGAHSLVRQACGVELDARPFPLDFHCASIEWPRAFAPAVARIWLNARSPESGMLGLLAMPFVGGRGAAMVLGNARVLARATDLGGAWERFVGEEPGLREVVGARQFERDLTRVTRVWGHAVRYGGPGAFLIGDAIHPVSPAGGQGANMAVADAVALAELVLRGGDDVLREYEKRRRRANARSVGITRGAALAAGVPRELLTTLLLFGAPRLARAPAMVQRILRFASRSFVES